MTGCDEHFLCDEMLARLGRWLRAAGYDVVIAKTGERDRDLLQQACDDDRLFITRDHKIEEYRDAAGRVVLLDGNQLSEQFRELSWLCSVNWLCQPFSRCLECNSELVEAAEELRSRVPPEVVRDNDTLRYCPHCDKLYWVGSHVQRMQQKLEQLNSGIWDGGLEDELLVNQEIEE